jgi:hypothetical protein
MRRDTVALDTPTQQEPPCVSGLCFSKPVLESAELTSSCSLHMPWRRCASSSSHSLVDRYRSCRRADICSLERAVWRAIFDAMDAYFQLMTGSRARLPSS